MIKQTILITLTALAISSCNNSKDNKMTADNNTTSVCSDDCKAKSKSGELSCKLTTPELQKRKETILASLKEQMTDKKELKDGYAFKFPGTDKMLDELTEFIKPERECCDFFTFNLSISGDKSEAWLELTGADGAKDFISTELGL
jgi:hypothetical protein